MDPMVKERLAAASARLGHTTRTDATAPRRLQLSRRWWLFISASFGVCIFALTGFTLLKSPLASQRQISQIVPSHIRQSVDFPVYYPDPQGLPTGYTLDQSSFSANGQAALYSVNYGAGQKIAFTIQSKPSEDELKTFYTNQLPLRNEVKTPVGTASIGVLNGQTFASIPTDKSWLLVTAPYDIDQDQLRKVLSSIRP